MTKEEEEVVLRNYAERIISGEFMAVAISMLIPNDSGVGDIKCFYSGGGVQALGLLRYHEQMVLDGMMDADEEEDA